MYEEKDHICSGANCMFCRIFSVGNADTVPRNLLVHQTLSKIKDITKTEGSALKNLTHEQSNRLETVEKLAFYDNLTGLYNAHAFTRELQEEVIRARRYKRPLSICIVIIEQFAQLKRLYGPLGSEAIFKHVALILKESLRGVDMAAYYKDEKFAILLPETNNAGALVTAERIAKRFSGRPVKLNSLILNISVSIGVATYLKHGQTYEEMIAAALAAISV